MRAVVVRVRVVAVKVSAMEGAENVVLVVVRAVATEMVAVVRAHAAATRATDLLELVRARVDLGPAAVAPSTYH